MKRNRALKNSAESGTANRAKFRPRARLVSILGEHLISDHVVGLIELVKNAYDADATVVSVKLRNLDAPLSTTIIIEDDGVGMTLIDVTDKFLCPATDHKAVTKKNAQRTARGRLPLGEKGVGRFAAQQLGLRLELVTRATDHPEVLAGVDWTEFESSSRFLDDVEIEVSERDPQTFPATGTRLTISGTRRAWTRADVEKLQKGLRRLRSPNQEMPDFEVKFACPEYPDLEDIHEVELVQFSHYTFRAHYNPTEDTLAYEYSSAHPQVKQRAVEATTDPGFSQRARSELSGAQPQCGPFFLNLYVWDRTRNYLAASGVGARDLDAVAGVSLFRDKLRVFPYGEPGDDWLQLDRDRIQNPSERISNNQVIGFVEIEQINNPDLMDKTNREGLIENPAFRDLKAVVRAAIQLFTGLWLQDRPREEKKAAAEPIDPPDKPLRKACDLATAITKTAREDIVVAIAEPPELPVTQVKAARMLEEELGSVKKSTDHLFHKNEVLLGLAATGMAAERVVHEFGRQVTRAVQALADLRQARNQDTALAVLGACLGELRNEFRVLAPYPGAPGERITRVDLREAAEVAAALNEAGLAKEQIDLVITGNSFTAKMRPASAIQVLDNLIFNSLFWVMSAPVPREIRITLNPTQRTVQVEDSGPGVAPEIEATLFEPFVTTRTGGRGLGLYIVRELLHGAGGNIELEPPGIFRIQFPSGGD